VERFQLKLGHLLKEIRIKRGISLSEVARELLIHEEYIEAIEDGIDERLPSGTYKRIYSRAYCKFLGVEYRDDTPEEKPPEEVQVTYTVEPKKEKAKKPVNEEELDLDLPFDLSSIDINRTFRIGARLIALFLIIWVIVKVISWIF
jgi:cytoskeletal protein RodZ